MKPASPAVALTMRLYRMLARAFPYEFASVYGNEMLRAAEDSVEAVWRRHGIAGLLRLLLDVVLRVPAEHLAELRRDARYGLRALARSPGFTAVAVTSLALGICIATCAYSEMNGLLRNLPGVPHPEQLVLLQDPVSYPQYERLRRLDNLFSAAFAYVAPVPFGVSYGERNQRTWGQVVTPSYFSVLGVRPSLGRFFAAGGENGAEVVVSRRFWEQHLGSDPAAIGRSLRINGQPCLIIGVGPERFLGASPALFAADLWLPIWVDSRLAPELAGNALERYDLSMFHMTGRLRPGVSEAAAEEQLTVAARQLAESYGRDEDYRHGRRVLLLGAGKLLPIRKQDVPFYKEFLLVMGGLVLLIACANVATMMLARAAERRREIALRLALGAGRARLLRQLLTESLLLALGAALPAFPLCVWLMHLLSQLRMPFPVEVRFDLTPDWRALLFTFGVTCAAGLAFGLAPALQATRTDLVTPLKEGGKVRLRKYRALSLRNGLVLCQMAASLMLLLITGYMGLGIQSTLGVQQGFDPRNLYLISLDPVRDGYSAERAAALFDKLLDRVRAQPGIHAACLTDTLPVALDGNTGVVVFDTARKTDWARRHIVGRGYFETTGIRILSGRGFQKQDETAGAPVIVSQEAVRRFWNGRDPVGRRVEISNGAASGNTGAFVGTIDFRAAVLAREPRTYVIVGVAADVSEDVVASKKHPAIYFPLRPADYAQPSLRGVTLMLRAVPGVDAIGAVRRQITALDPDVTAFQARSMTEHIAQFMSALKGAAWTYGLMGLFGLILAAVGMAGVTAYAVARRAHEIGIRMALGARKGDVLALVMKEGTVLVLAGTAIGMALAWAGTRALSGLFYTVGSVQTSDPLLLAGAPALLAGLALLACYLPARRSARIDPVVTLRME